jgi:hypothetical protein
MASAPQNGHGLSSVSNSTICISVTPFEAFQSLAGRAPQVFPPVITAAQRGYGAFLDDRVDGFIRYSDAAPYLHERNCSPVNPRAEAGNTHAQTFGGLRQRTQTGFLALVPTYR